MKETIIRIYRILGLLQNNPKNIITQIRNKYLEKTKVTEEEINFLIEKEANIKKIKIMKMLI